VLFIAGIEGSPLRYRVRLPAEGLRLHGVTSEVRWYSDPALARAVRRADAVVVYRVPATKWMLDVVAEARRRGTPVLFDADDLIFDPDIACDLPAVAAMAPSVRTQYLDGVHRYRTMLEACDAFVASTPMLARHTHELTGLPVHRFDNGVGLVLGRLADVELQRPRKGGRVRVGYFSGTDTHDHDWRMIEGRVGQVLEQNPNVDLLLVGYLPDSPELERFGRRVQRLPFQPWDTLPAALRDLDVNLAPLTDDRFNVAKSAVKWLEAALVETPTVASPTEPFRDAIDDGRTGRLAATGDEWVDAINQLVRSEDDRVRMGQRARRAALLRWSPHLQGRRYLDLLEGTKAVTRTTAWAPVVVDEPRRARAVEPYLEVDAPPTTGERWRALTDRGRAFVARHGVGGAIARAPARAWRAVSARAKGRG
jgi:hypothetical protein